MSITFSFVFPPTCYLVSKEAVSKMTGVLQLPTVRDCLTLSHLSCENCGCNFEKTFCM